MKYIEIQILSTTEASDAVYYILTEAGAAGVVIEDPNDFKMLNQDETSWDYVEEELINSLGEDVKIKGYFTEAEFSEKKRSEIQKQVDALTEFGLDKGKGTITIREVNEEDWANAWKQYYKPTKVGQRVVIKPTWETYTPAEDDIIIELDPGMAFGTGTHETTIMCVQLLEKYVNSGSLVFDVGCGSGILGITAAKLGAKRVICVDIDEVCCRVSKENVEINKADERVEVRCGNLLDVVDEKADVIVANIIADIIIGFAKDARGFIHEDGIFISSGIIKDRRDDVLNKLKQENYAVLEVLEMGEWCAIAAQRK